MEEIKKQGLILLYLVIEVAMAWVIVLYMGIPEMIIVVAPLLVQLIKETAKHLLKLYGDN